MPITLFSRLGCQLVGMLTADCHDSIKGTMVMGSTLTGASVSLIVSEVEKDLTRTAGKWKCVAEAATVWDNQSGKSTAPTLVGSTLLETLASRGRDELVAATKAAVERALENEMQAGRTTVDAATFDTVLLAASEAQEEYLGTWVCRYNHRNNRTEWHDGSAFTGIPCVFV
ncbi:MAG: hypothetical protein ACYTG1_04925 [Planctomycetota bacterium]|jgi:hypothetical protein